MLRILGLTILLISMAWASNWDLPKETHADWEAEHQEEIQRYEEERGKTYQIIIDGEVYEGAYIDGMWYEPAELYQEVVDAFMGEKEYIIVESDNGGN